MFGIALVQLAGWLVLNPIIALIAANIVRIEVRLLRDTTDDLLDRALPPDDQERISDVLSHYGREDVQFHAVRTRAARQRRFISMHVLVPGRWSVKKGQNLSEQIEKDLGKVLPESTSLIRIEPSEDPASLEDQGLQRFSV